MTTSAAAVQEERTAEVLSLLERRAERVRASQQTSVEEAIVWVAEFPVGDERFAVPLTSLRAAVPLRMVTPVPLSPPEIVGIVRFQGEVITAYSLASLLGVRGWREDPAVLIIVERPNGTRVALDCEQVPKAVALPAAVVESAHPASSGPFLEITTRDLRSVSLLDLNRLFSRREER